MVPQLNFKSLTQPVQPIKVQIRSVSPDYTDARAFKSIEQSVLHDRLRRRPRQSVSIRITKIEGVSTAKSRPKFVRLNRP